jgi:hypothetical protein
MENVTLLYCSKIWDQVLRLTTWSVREKNSFTLLLEEFPLLDFSLQTRVLDELDLLLVV